MVCFKLKQLTTISLGDDAKSITVYQKSAIEKINKPMSGKPPMGYILSKKTDQRHCRVFELNGFKLSKSGY